MFDNINFENYPPYRTLKTLGLTLYEIKCYLALNSRSYSTAADLIEISGVPRSKSYEALQNLVEMGYIQREGGRPVIFRARAPSLVLLNKKRKLLEDFELTINNMQEEWDNREVSNTQSISVYGGESLMFKNTIKFIEKAKEKVIIGFRFIVDDEFEGIIQALKKAKLAGVHIIIMIFPDILINLSDEYKKKLNSIVTPTIAPVPIRVTIVDGKEMILSIPGFVINKIDFTLTQTIHIKIPEIVSFMEKTLSITENMMKSNQINFKFLD